MHLTLEKELFDFLHNEETVTFSTGFQTNLGIISAIVGRNDYVICDRENHASIYDGCKLSYGKMLRYHHGDMADLENKLASVPESAGSLIVTYCVFSMGGDIAKLPEIVSLAKKYSARVMVDDAHGLGVIGDGGRGTASYFGLENDVDIPSWNLQQALASLGLMATCRSGGKLCAPQSPVHLFRSITAGHLRTALDRASYIAANERVASYRSSATTSNGLVARGLSIRQSETPIIPIFTYDLENTLKTAKRLYEGGVYVNPVLPPAAPEGGCMLRTSLMATHTESLLDEAMDIMKNVLGKAHE